jgi:hypothetical protein
MTKKGDKEKVVKDKSKQIKDKSKSCESLKAARSRAKGRHAKGKIFGQMAKAGCFRKGKRSKKQPKEEELQAPEPE